jgi:hypothetical protein
MGFITEDQGPDKTGLGVEEVAPEGSADYTRSVQSSKAGGSLGEYTPITFCYIDDQFL